MKPSPLSTNPQTYRVPERFGIAAIMSLMTLMSLLFGVLRSLDAPPYLFLFFGVMTLAISIAQMFFGHVPRVVSIAVGAGFLPVFSIIVFILDPPKEGFWLILLGLPCIAIGGGILGYLTGTIAAGVFLVLDQMNAQAEQRRLDAEIIYAEVVEDSTIASAK